MELEYTAREEIDLLERVLELNERIQNKPPLHLVDGEGNVVLELKPEAIQVDKVQARIDKLKESLVQ